MNTDQDALLRQYQTLVEAAGYVMFTLDQNGHLLYVSGAARMTGYDPDSLRGQYFFDMVHADAREEVIAFYQQQQQQRVRESNHQFPIVTASGEMRWMEVTMVLNDDLTFQALSRDITDRRMMEDALLHSEERNNAMLEAIPDLMFAVRRDGTYTDFNWYHDVAPIVPRDQMIGLNLRDFGFGQDMLEKSFESIERTLTTGKLQTFFFESNANGTVGAFEARVVRLDEEEALFIVRDVSDLRHAQEQLAENVRQLSTLVEFEEELAARLDLDYVLMMGLDAAMRLSGANSGYIALQEEDGSMHVAQLLGDHNRELSDQLLRAGKGVVGRVLRQRYAELVPDVSADPDYVSNRSRTQALMAFPLLSQDTLVGVLNLETNKAANFTQERFDLVKLMAARIAVAVDNARLYRQVATQLTQLRDLYKQVSTLEQMKTDMIRIASHDLRNPLFVITGHLEMLRWDIKRGPLEVARVGEHADHMEKSAKTMQKIIHDILSLERIENSVNEDTSVVFDLCKLVEQVFADQQPHAHLLNRKLQLNLPDDELMVRGDPPQMREAVGNLVSNAIKYTRDGGQIHVRIWTEGSKVQFEVVDNGIGIPEDQQGRLFQAFYRAQTPETVRVEGTGLGLHLVKNIIERHGGSMRFKSEYGVGSTFGFTLRLAPDV
ncbi:MAG: ATP-binding protein [bacterium]|nr:ATP-binding protein [bacterium]